MVLHVFLNPQNSSLMGMHQNTNLSNQILIEPQHILQRSESQFHIQLCELRLSICSKIFISKTSVKNKKRKQTLILVLFNRFLNSLITINENNLQRTHTQYKSAITMQGLNPAKTTCNRKLPCYLIISIKAGYH